MSIEAYNQQVMAADPKDYVILLKDLHKSFGPKKVLRGVNLMVKKGENMVIIGGSGTGKSVTLKNTIGLMHPDKGEVWVDGKHVPTLGERELSKLRLKFGYCFQGAALFDSISVWENVAFGLMATRKISRADARVIASEKLRLVGLAGIEDAMPANISGGMKTRVGFARAICTDPSVILFDEPTTGLDPIMANVINELIVKLQTELHVTSVTITHDMESAFRIATRIAMLYLGRVMFVGTPDEVRKTDNPYVRQFVEGRTVGPITVD